MGVLKSLLFLFTGVATVVQAQTKNLKNINPVYVDRYGVLRWTKGGAEAAFFGVNYTVPFAYGYRSHKALGKDLEKAIDEDVYHFARMGLNAFRVHVWDTEISDSLGNLKENEHLRLFDYLVFKLKERGIKIMLTPLAFWGNGYPEPDEKTGSFSSIWNKQQVLVTEAAIKAQVTYLQQFLKHINPYTQKTYGADNDVIAIEINNEPHHSGTKQQAADYISRMVAAVKGTGWTKPVFYNISESPAYADAVANSRVDGVSFQWYPTGLVAGYTLQGNYLPHVDVYRIPFGDTIRAYRNKARMVYEFDAGDVFQSYMYPAMARSFRTAGFQWATQFAYDPMATAYANTEYQTHYLNLAYTPSKAISLMIAAKAFHQLPRLQAYGTYPADSLFQNFRVSYRQSLSEWNSDTAFYYSNSTTTSPRTQAKLKHVAGVGSSTVVAYSGSGAYFLDQLPGGAWRLEVMPDAVFLRDPFEKASPKKEVTRIAWNTHKMTINLPHLQNFFVTPLNKGNSYETRAIGNRFTIRPGTYIISNQKKEHSILEKLQTGSVGLYEFVAPPTPLNAPYVKHLPPREISEDRSYLITAIITGLDSSATADVELQTTPWQTLRLQKQDANQYTVVVPANDIKKGILNYRIIIRRPNDTIYTYPGGHNGDPYAWDNHNKETYETFVVPQHAALALFNATRDRTGIQLYNPDWRSNSIQYTTTATSGQLALKLTANKPEAKQQLGFQCYVGNEIRKRQSDLDLLDQLVIRAGSTAPQQLHLTLVTSNGAAFTQNIPVDTAMQEIVVPLTAFKKDRMLLLPRAYPGFMPLYFRSGSAEPFSVNNLDRIQLSFEPSKKSGVAVSIMIESVRLEGRKR
jgi:hypothetical protein